MVSIGTGAPLRIDSSKKMNCSMAERPWPPHSLGQPMPSQPSLAHLLDHLAHLGPDPVRLRTAPASTSGVSRFCVVGAQLALAAPAAPRCRRSPSCPSRVARAASAHVNAMSSPARPPGLGARRTRYSPPRSGGQWGRDERLLLPPSNLQSAPGQDPPAHDRARPKPEEPVTMPEAVIVATGRTPIGRANKGSLVECRPDDLSRAGHPRRCSRKVPQLDPADGRGRDPRLRPAGRRGGLQRRPRGRHPGRAATTCPASPSTATAPRRCRPSAWPPTPSGPARATSSSPPASRR